ncbi:MAG: pyridoxamine 5'-phosphate oxidase [Acidimicrobiia bacterium]
MHGELGRLRTEYGRTDVDEAHVDRDPIAQFERWLDEAVAAGVREPDAMTVATASAAGDPSARTVSLRGVDASGFVFFTHYDSRKGREIAENARAALVFHWREVERQVRVTGRVARLSAEESTSYWVTRPRGSRISAWASPQGQVVAGREMLDAWFDETDARFPTDDIPLPPFWGGYRIEPAELELWQGRPNRLHDRLRYRRDTGGGWILERLAP